VAHYYLQIKALHVACVQLSVLLFVLRAALTLSGRERIARVLPVRVLSWSIDTVLLSAALVLLTILPGAMFANHWLTLKLVLLLVYVGCGRIALRSGLTRGRRLAWLAAALATVAAMVGIARAHDVRGWWLLLAS
jgi:uncharacterized membrane protein SirB2